MEHEPTDQWTLPCDLCGSNDYEAIDLPDVGQAHRCRVCGLVAVDDRRADGSRASHNGHDPAGSVSAPRALRALRRTLRTAARDGAESVLLIGAASLALVNVAREQGLRMMALVEPDASVREIPDVIIHSDRISGAPFLPDQFDVIVCAGGPETMDSPSRFFERSRVWLASGGALIIGGVNWRSLPALLWRRNWLRRNGRGVHWLLTPDVIRSYADRYGFEVRDLQTRSMPAMICSIASPRRRVTSLRQFSMVPLSLVAGILNMGDEINVTLLKRGVSARPMLRNVQEESNESPGLAPALYSQAHRSGVRRNGLQRGI